MIEWFNVQCYYSFSYNTYKSIINNGYPPEKIVMGHESGQFSKETFQKALDAVKAIDVGIKGQREVLSGMINLQFVQIFSFNGCFFCFIAELFT